MRLKSILLTAAFCFAATLATFAADTYSETWKLNEAKSKIPAGMAKNTSLSFSVEGDQFKYVVEGVSADGKPLRYEWIGKFDGKPYPVTGDPDADSFSFQRVDDRHYKMARLKEGQENSSDTIEFSSNMMTRTVTTHVKTADGKVQTVKYVYERQ